MNCKKCGIEMGDLRDIEYDSVDLMIDIDSSPYIEVATFCSHCESDITIKIPVDKLNDGNFVIHEFLCDVDWKSAKIITKEE